MGSHPEILMLEGTYNIEVGVRYMKVTVASLLHLMKLGSDHRTGYN